MQASDQVIDTNVLAQKVDLKVTAKEGELTGHNLVAVRLAEYSYAITDANDANGKTIKGFDVKTSETYKEAVISALKTAGILDATTSEPKGPKESYTPTLPAAANPPAWNADNPMQWVAGNLLDSTNSPYAGYLRDFLTALAKETAITGATGETLTVNGDGSEAASTAYNPATKQGGVDSGIYVILDKTVAPESGTDTKVYSIPMMTGTGIGRTVDFEKELNEVTYTKLTTTTGTALDLGAIEYKPTEPTLDKQFIVSDGTQKLSAALVGNQRVGSIDDLEHFALISEVPNTTGYDKYVFNISDTQGKGQTVNPKSFKAYLVKDNDTVFKDSKTDNTDGVVELTKDTDFKIVGFTAGTDSTTFTVQFGSDDKGIVGNDNFKATDYLGWKVVVTYDATLDQDAYVNGGTATESAANTNTAKLTYSNNPADENQTKDSAEAKTQLYTGRVPIKKTDMNDKVLPGAKFSLVRDAGTDTANQNGANPGKGTSSGDYVALTKVSSDVYRVADSTETGTVTEFEIPTDGDLEILGIEGTYTLKETAAPKGFSGLLPSFEFTAAPEMVAFANLATDAGDTTIAESGQNLGAYGLVSVSDTAVNGAKTIVVKNGRTLFDMPKTGSFWMAIYIGVGILCTLAAWALLLVRRRPNNNAS